ncbi:MAG: alanine racemase [Firmicutes bacterium]|nr:alanine racemase [Bacillota bacterium]
MRDERPLLEEVDTPALVVDLDVMDRNIERMATRAREAGVRLRPHAKTHKSPWIAHRQIRAGAAGITVAKLGEAEVMLDAGITDILVAYPIVGELKLRRLQRLLEEADLIISVDSVEAAEAAGQAGRQSGRGRVRVYVDVDTGHRRLGQAPGAATVELAERIARVPGVEVVGLMSHAGHLAGASSQTALTEEARRAAQALVETAEVLRRRGLAIEEVSPGSTPGAVFDAGVCGVTEIRPGTYVFNDRNTVERWAAAEADCALTVLTTVVSPPPPRPAGGGGGPRGGW